MDHRTRNRLPHAVLAGRSGRIVAVLGALCLLAGLLAMPLAVPAAADPLPVPTNVGHTLIGNGTSRITWTTVPGASGYKVLCEQDPHPDVDWYVGGGTSNLVDLRLFPGYSLCAVNAIIGFDESAFSVGVIANVPALGAPQNLSRTSYSGVVDLYWNNVIDQSIDGWTVTSVPATGTKDVHVAGVAIGTVHLAVADLPIGVAHTFTVTPYKVTSTPYYEKYLGPAASFSPVTVQPTPAAPTVTDVSTDAFAPVGIAEMWWDAPVNNGSPAVDKYRVTLSRGSGQDPIVRLYESTDRHAFIELDGMSGIEIEGVSVEARNSNGWGPAGSWSGGSVFLAPKPAAPQNLFTQAVGTDGVQLHWDAPSSLDGYNDPPSYEVRIEGPVNDSTTIDSDGYQFSSLTPGWYLAKVRGTGPLNSSRWITRWFAVGTPCDPAFSDVTGEPFCTPVSWMVRQGIGSGFPGGLFKPSAPVTRQAMASFLYKAKGSPYGASPTCTTAPFPDVPANHPFCGQIKWLVDQGITAGYPDGTFKPTGAVTRQAMASFLFKASDRNRLPGGGATTPESCNPPGPFSDVSHTHSFCGAIAWLANQGVTSGYPDGTFQPTAAVSRQAMAAFLYRWRP